MILTSSRSCKGFTRPWRKNITQARGRAMGPPTTLQAVGGGKKWSKAHAQKS